MTMRRAVPDNRVNACEPYSTALYTHPSRTVTRRQKKTMTKKNCSNNEKKRETEKPKTPHFACPSPRSDSLCGKHTVPGHLDAPCAAAPPANRPVRPRKPWAIMAPWPPNSSTSHARAPACALRVKRPFSPRPSAHHGCEEHIHPEIAACVSLVISPTAGNHPRAPQEPAKAPDNAWVKRRF